VSCRVCASRDVVWLCRTYNEHSQTHWLDHFRCRFCGSVFVGNDVGANELAAAYASLDEKSYYAETGAASQAKVRAAAGEVATLAAHDARMIDLGGGNGAFVRALWAERFTDVSIHEIPGAGLADLSGVVRQIYRDTDYATIPPESFDVVTMMDVLEHVPHPPQTFAAAKRMLRSGGILYLHTPVVTVLDRIMHLFLKFPLLDRLARLWQRARTSIFHLQNYTPRALTLLAEREGFQVLRVEAINELSWPLDLYVRVYLVEKARMPRVLVPLVTGLAAVVVRSRLHANKGVLAARRL
jgi:2-polyprenyl-3-methyl-5-hydroxy-6-metoxy-1,4-benzoquinol methylase